LSDIPLYQISVWILPVLIAITFHEAAHAYVARWLGDGTASELGRVSLNPIRHIDPMGTILLPALLLIAHSPFLFGYAKPVPVNYRKLKSPRLDMAKVAVAGPIMNILLAILAAGLFHLLPHIPATAAQWTADNLKNALVINVVLAIFNLLPVPPLDGGRIAVGLLPGFLAIPLARLERYGMLVLIVILIGLPSIGRTLGFQFDFIAAGMRFCTSAVIDWILVLTFNA
jgi:Zn-dependent protease